MKKLFSISFALLILLSGMHLSIATHLCGNEVAAVKWSFSGKEATCGMETSDNTCPENKTLASNCCHNEISQYTVDANYVPSFVHGKEVKNTLLQVFFIPVSFASASFVSPYSICANVSPPGPLIASHVSLADICVFRI
jgi:hypothetical protein